MKRILVGFALLASVCASFVSRSASAGESAAVCIDPKAQEAASACGALGGVAFDPKAHAGALQPGFHTIAPASTVTKKNVPPPPDAPVPRDPRNFRLNARKKGLLAVEINGLETLFSQTARGANDRVTIARRLAEDYVELESSAFREKTEAEIARDAAKKAGNMQAASKAQADANAADVVLKQARGNAVRYYALVKTDYPQYPQLDEVLYYLAYEYEQAGDFANARKVYFELIQSRPASKYVPNAYLAFGELFFNEAQGDPTKFPLAAQAYQEVIKYPPPDNKLFGFAHYKLAYVFWNQGDFAHAINEFKKTIDFGVAFSQLPGAAKLAENARRDVVPVYALSGDPERAYGFFKNLSGDPSGSNEKTYKMMDDLGQNYLDTGHYPEGITLYKDLLARDRSGVKSCAYQAHITEATMALRSSQKDAIVSELGSQLDAYRRFKASDKPEAAKLECANKTASLVTETAVAWHIEAVGSQGQRGTGDKKTMTLAAVLYKKAADTWTKEEFSHFTFPHIVREDWPTRKKIAYALADILYVDEKWADCGPAFDAVVDEDPRSPESAEPAYAAAICYQKEWEKEHAHGEARRTSGNMPGPRGHAESPNDATRLAPKELSVSQKGMLRAFDRYACFVKPAADDTQGQAQLCEVKYARARTYFEAQHWQEAAAAFREIAKSPCDPDSGIYAAQLYLESANVVASHTEGKRHACYGEMSADVPRFVELYCQGDLATKNQEACTSLNVVGVDLLRKDAEDEVARADKSTNVSEATPLYEDGGNKFFDLFRRFCQEPVQAGKPAQAEKCDELAYNGARAFQAARLLAKAISARKALIEFDARTNGRSVAARKATYEIGQNYQAIAVYELAAEWFEKYQRADGRADKADVALEDAVLLRLGLGQEEQAIEDARQFARAYGAKKPREAAQVAFAIGGHYAEKEDWEHARSSLTSAMRTIDGAAPDIVIQAHATLGRAELHTRGGDARARAEFAKVRSLWQDPADAEQKIRAAYPNEDKTAADKRVLRALVAVGEAYFQAAEEARLAIVEPLKFPVYRGAGTKEDVLHHIDTKVKDWYVKKMAAIQKVEPEYWKIVGLKPHAPPKWVIAAGSRAGLMWGDFVDDFRRAPVPAAWKGTQLEQVYNTNIDLASEPYKVKHAKPALKHCLDLAVEFQFFDGYSRACEVWLAKNYKSEYHVVDELRGSPSIINSGLDERAPPIKYIPKKKEGALSVGAVSTTAN